MTAQTISPAPTSRKEIKNPKMRVPLGRKYAISAPTKRQLKITGINDESSGKLFTVIFLHTLVRTAADNVAEVPMTMSIMP